MSNPAVCNFEFTSNLGRALSQSPDSPDLHTILYRELIHHKQPTHAVLGLVLGDMQRQAIVARWSELRAALLAPAPYKRPLTNDEKVYADYLRYCEYAGTDSFTYKNKTYAGYTPRTIEGWDFLRPTQGPAWHNGGLSKSKLKRDTPPYVAASGPSIPYAPSRYVTCFEHIARASTVTVFKNGRTPNFQFTITPRPQNHFWCKTCADYREQVHACIVTVKDNSLWRTVRKTWAALHEARKRCSARTWAALHGVRLLPLNPIPHRHPASRTFFDRPWRGCLRPGWKPMSRERMLLEISTITEVRRKSYLRDKSYPIERPERPVLLGVGKGSGGPRETRETSETSARDSLNK